jgi:hypothetical protein
MHMMPRGGGPLVGCRDGTQILASRRPRSASNNRKRLPSVTLPRWRSQVLCVKVLRTRRMEFGASQMTAEIRSLEVTQIPKGTQMH